MNKKKSNLINNIILYSLIASAGFACITTGVANIIHINREEELNKSLSDIADSTLKYEFHLEELVKKTPTEIVVQMNLTDTDSVIDPDDEDSEPIADEDDVEEADELLSNERLPEGHTNTYRCMDYRSLTNKASEQWQMQLKCYSDMETGIRTLVHNGEAYYCSALASAYTQVIGDSFLITLANGHQFRIVCGDYKNPLYDNNPNFFGQPDKNYDGLPTTSVIEFITDKDYMPTSVKNAGTMSALKKFGGLYGTGGNIVEIKYLGYIDWREINV